MREFSDVEDADGAGGEDCTGTASQSWMRRRCGDGLCFSAQTSKGIRRVIGECSFLLTVLTLRGHGTGAYPRDNTA